MGVGCVGALAAASEAGPRLAGAARPGEASALEDYMARVDPSVHTWTRTVRVAEDTSLERMSSKRAIRV